MNPSQRHAVCQQRLTQALAPTFLEIIDDSHLHIGHVGAQSGGSHFKIIVASPLFSGKSTLACHRLIYAALAGLIGGEIHAVQICLHPTATPYN